MNEDVTFVGPILVCTCGWTRHSPGPYRVRVANEHLREHEEGGSE